MNEKIDKVLSLSMSTSRLKQVACVFICFVGMLGCVPAKHHRAGGAQDRHDEPHHALADPHKHVTDVSQTSIFESVDAQIRFVEVSPSPELKSSEGLANGERSFLAFTRCEPECVLLVRDEASEKLWEIKVPSFSPARPFDDVLWMNGSILVFDQWSQPSYGVHYAVDVATRKLLQASPFNS